MCVWRASLLFVAAGCAAPRPVPQSTPSAPPAARVPVAPSPTTPDPAAAPAPPAEPRPTGELRNPGFEAWTGELPDGWAPIERTKVAREAGSPRAGAAAARLATDGWSRGVSQEVSFPTPHPAGSRFGVSLWLRHVAGSTARPVIQFGLYYTDGAQADLLTEAAPEGWHDGGRWSGVRAALAPPHPVARVLLRVLPNTDAAQTFDVDEAALVVEPPAK